jgi:hypothetical protein
MYKQEVEKVQRSAQCRVERSYLESGTSLYIRPVWVLPEAPLFTSDSCMALYSLHTVEDVTKPNLCCLGEDDYESV